MLGWLGRLGVAGIEPLALALGLHERTVYSHVERLAKRGLVERVRGEDDAGGVVTITRAGARECEERGFAGIVSPRSTAPSSARHGRAVSWAAARAEAKGWRWLGPAELKADRGWQLLRDDGARHLPDLGLVHNSKRVAVEVELHAKAPRRLRAILRGYRRLVAEGSLTSVTYVVDRREVDALLRREGCRLGLEGMLQIGPLDGLMEVTRKFASAEGEEDKS